MTTKKETPAEKIQRLANELSKSNCNNRRLEDRLKIIGKLLNIEGLDDPDNSSVRPIGPKIEELLKGSEYKDKYYKLTAHLVEQTMEMKKSPMLRHMMSHPMFHGMM